VCVLEKVSFSAGIKDTELLLRGRMTLDSDLWPGPLITRQKQNQNQIQSRAASANPGQRGPDCLTQTDSTHPLEFQFIYMYISKYISMPQMLQFRGKTLACGVAAAASGAAPFCPRAHVRGKLIPLSIYLYIYSQDVCVCWKKFPSRLG